MAFLGMRGTGDWVEGQRPEDWGETIMFLYPNGKAPLTAILGMMGKKRATDPRFHWWEEQLPEQSAVITGVYNNAALAAPYNPAVDGVAPVGTILYFKMSQADVEQFRPTHTVLLKTASDLDVEGFGKIITVQADGANSYVGVYMLSTDAITTAGHYLNSANILWVVGSANPEGSNSVDSILYDPEDNWNYTQIFKWAIEHTETAKATQLRTGDTVKKARRQALEMYSIEMEKAFIFGRRTKRTGANRKIERTTGGIKSFLTTHVYNFATEAGVVSWLANGEDFLDSKLEIMFRKGRSERLALCGSGALLGINKLIKDGGKAQWQMNSMSTSYGIKVTEWVTPFGALYLKTHPLFSQQPFLRNSMLVVDTENIRRRVLRDTKYRPQIQDNDLDGEKSEYVGEMGVEVHFEETHGWFDNIGVDPS